MFKALRNLKNNNPGRYLALQITLTLLLIALVALTATSFTSPEWLRDTMGEDVRGLASEYVVFRPEEDPEIDKKKLDISIDTDDDNAYNLTDSEDTDYYFEINPFIDDGISTQISPQITDRILEVDFASTGGSDNGLMDQLIMETHLSVGSPEIPLDMELEVKNDSQIKVDISEHEIERFAGTFRSKDTSLSFTQNSVPQDFSIVAEKGLTTLEIPEDATYSLDYEVSSDAKFFINNREITGEGIHTQ